MWLWRRMQSRIKVYSQLKTTSALLIAADSLLCYYQQHFDGAESDVEENGGTKGSALALTKIKCFHLFHWINCWKNAILSIYI